MLFVSSRGERDGGADWKWKKSSRRGIAMSSSISEYSNIPVLDVSWRMIARHREGNKNSNGVFGGRSRQDGRGELGVGYERRERRGTKDRTRRSRRVGT